MTIFNIKFGIAVVAMFCASQSIADGGGYLFEDLGLPVGQSSGMALSVSSSGMVRGIVVSNDRLTQSPFTWTKSRGFKVHSPGFYPRETNSEGVTAGTIFLNDGLYAAAIMNRVGDVFEILPRTDSSSEAMGINDRNEVVGITIDAAGFTQAFFWSPVSGVDALASLASEAGSSAADINNAGEIVGTIPANGQLIQYQTAVKWKTKNDKPVALIPDEAVFPDYSGSFALAINDGGSVAVTVLKGGIPFCASKSRRGLVNILFSDDLDSCTSFGIAADGLVLGAGPSSANYSDWKSRVMSTKRTGVTLPTPYAQPGNWSNGYSISSKGSIVGGAIDADGVSHIVRWIEAEDDSEDD